LASNKKLTEDSEPQTSLRATPQFYALNFFYDDPSLKASKTTGKMDWFKDICSPKNEFHMSEASGQNGTNRPPHDSQISGITEWMKGCCNPRETLGFATDAPMSPGSPLRVDRAGVGVILALNPVGIPSKDQDKQHHPFLKCVSVCHEWCHEWSPCKKM
jgi:hypothetical protein